jgi:hypothetical protein
LVENGEFHSRPLEEDAGQTCPQFLGGKLEAVAPGQEVVDDRLSGEWERYNLEDDSAEMDNLGGRRPERLEQMIAMWEQYKTDNEVLDISLDLSEKIK